MCWKTSKFVKTRQSFSHPNWGMQSAEYARAIRSMSAKNWARVLAGARELVSHNRPLFVAGYGADPSTAAPAPVRASAIDISDGSDGGDDICDGPDLLD